MFIVDSPSFIPSDISSLIIVLAAGTLTCIISMLVLLGASKLLENKERKK